MAAGKTRSNPRMATEKPKTKTKRNPHTDSRMAIEKIKNKNKNKRTKTNPRMATEKTKNKGTKTKPDTENTAHEIMGHHDDLLTELLCRLPTKSILRFKSVSKQWLSLISSSSFCHRINLKLISKSISGIIVYRYDTLEYELINLNSSFTRPRVPFEFLKFPVNATKVLDGVKVIHSCNGLFLCSSREDEVTHNFHGNHFYNYFVYNPTTEQYTLLRRILSNNRLPYVCLAFEPSKSTHYKAICLLSLLPSERDQTQYEVEIYSSKTGAWRQSECVLSVPKYTNLYQSVFFNGAIHWFSNWRIFYFNMDEETLRETPVAPTPDGWEGWSRGLSYFGESRGHLHLAIKSRGTSFRPLHVYEIEKDYSRWFLKYQVEVEVGVFAKAFPEVFSGFSLFCVVREEKDEDSYLVLHLPKKVIRYNLGKKTFEMLHKFIRDRGNKIAFQSTWGCNYAFQYMESLASV